MKRKIIFAAVIILCIALLSACATKGIPDSTTSTAPTATEKTAVNIAVLKGPTGMGCVKLMEENENGAAANKYNFTVASAPEQITAKLISGELDIAFIPTNAIAALNSKTGGKVKIAAVSTLGVLYLLENGDTVNSVKDLAGKTALSSGKGSTAQYVLEYILIKNGLTPGENVFIEYAAEHTEAASAALAGKYDIVVLPEPFVSSLQMQNADFTIKLDLSEEWEKAAGSTLTMGAVAVRSEFAENNAEAVEKFIDDYKRSADFVNGNMQEAAALVEKYGIAKAAIAQKALPKCSIVCITGDEMKLAAEQFLTVVSEYDASAIGGKLPAEDFYYTVK